MIFMQPRPGITGPLRSLVGLALGLSASLAEAAPPIEMGVWINHTGKGAVEIRPCGASGASANRLCGFIVWLKEPNKKSGEPLTDGYNPDAAKRRRTICGLPVLGSLQRVSGGWDNGWVYDPEQGSQFDAAIELDLARSARPHRLQGREVLLQVVHVEARARRPASAATSRARRARHRAMCAPPLPRRPPRKRRSSRCRAPFPPCGRRRSSRASLRISAVRIKKARPYGRAFCIHAARRWPSGRRAAVLAAALVLLRRFGGRDNGLLGAQLVETRQSGARRIP